MRYFMQVIEDDPRYWEAISSALAIGWLELVVSVSIICALFYRILLFTGLQVPSSV